MNLKQLRNKLNEQQFYAATRKEGVYLVLSGAGSGKTTTLTYRVARLVHLGVDPNQILLLTFTRKAAKEMTDRANKLLGTSKLKIVSGTFHSIALQFILKYKKELGYDSSPTIMDTDDSKDLIELIKNKVVPKDKFFPNKGALYNIFSKASNTRSSIAAIILDDYKSFEGLTDKIEDVYTKYCTYKREKGLLDFDDLLEQFLELLSMPRAMKIFSKMFKYVMVDEFQDTNNVQFEIVKKLASQGNLMVVGDDAQSCYMFRGANFKNIIDFPRQFKGCETIVITQNYRSTNPILNLTNAIMEPAKEKFEKELYSTIEGKVKPRYVIVNDEAEQAAYIGKEIEKLIGGGTKPNDIAVLFRASRASVYIEPEIVGRGLKFVKFGGMSFIDSAHIKDIVSLYRICISKSDPIAWHRSLSMLPKVGAKTSSTLINQLVEEDKEYSVLDQPLTEGLYKLIKKVRKCSPKEVEKITEHIFDYYMPFFNKKYNKAEWRKTDLKAFKQLALNYDSVRKLINNLTIDPNDSKDKDTRDRIILSTIHSAKGLEYKIVFLVNVVEDGLPSGMCKNDAEIEEERRLFYIATTRAKERLHMLAPFGKDVNKESRFVKEIKNFKKHVEIVDLTKKIARHDSDEDRPDMDFFRSKMKIDMTKPPWE